MLKEITLLINDEEYPVEVEPGDLLVDVLRDRIGLKGTKKGCGTGDCGACTVLMNGRPVVSCLVLAVAAEGKSIETVEGLSADGELHPLQQAFVERGAIQCGYCTPGLLMLAKAFLRENPHPSESEIRVAIAGNLCRCTGYRKIIDALVAASEGLERSAMTARASIKGTLPRATEVIAGEEPRVIARSVSRVDAVAKVRGKTLYSYDMCLPNMLYGKILFNNRPHALIKHIDTREARAVPGVRAVITGADTPDRRYGVFLQDRYILAKERVLFVGEPVAAVAATSEQAAREAVGLIRVTYDDLPTILDPEAALLPGAPLLHPGSTEYVSDFPYVRYGNVCMDAKVGIGDVEAGFRQSDLIIEDTYDTQPVSQVPLETHACVAGFDPSGRLTVWTGTQELSVCHFELSQALELPMTKVRVIPLWIGGGFGGKLKTHLEPICALLAMKADRPVKIALSREEEFISVPARAPYIIRMKTGVKRNGLLVAREVHILADVGGYSDHVIGTAVVAMESVQGSYNIPNCVASARAIYTNNPNWGCMRGYGDTEMNFAVEAHTDVIAQKLGMDPAELRYMNLWRDGDMLISTQRIFGVEIKKTMDKALVLSGYRDRKGRLGPHRGIGIANITMSAGMLSSSAVIKINEDSTVSIVTGIIDIGTGTHTVLCQIVAETLGLPIERIQVASQDSDNSPYDFGTSASRTVFDAGSAVRLAAVDIRDKLVQIAADTLKRRVDELEYREGRVFVLDEPDVALDISALVGISLYEQEGPVIGYGRWMDAQPFQEPVGEGYPGGPAGTFCFGTHVAEVEVDPETGNVRVVNYTAVHDAGRVLNPLGLEGQIEGGVAQGVGYGLLEELVLENGRIQNPNLADYKVPTAVDIPPIATDFVGEPDARGPFGAKGAGEHPTIAPAPAIVNAILDATGVALRRLPVTPERLYFALRERKS